MEIFHLSKSMDMEKSIFASFSSTRDDHPKKQIRTSFPTIPSSLSSTSSSSSLNHPKDHLDSLKEEESPPSIVQVNAMDTSRINKTRVSSSKLQFKNKHSIPCSTSSSSSSSSSRSLSHEISILSSTHEDEEEEDQDEIKVKKSYFLRDLYIYTSSLLYTNNNNNYLELFFSLFNYNQNGMNYSYFNRDNGESSSNHNHNHHHILHSTNRSRTEGAIYLSSLSSRCKSLQKEIRFLERESEEGYYENVYLHQLYEQSVYSKTQFGRVVYMFAYFLR
jgi:hypothetical protein